MKPESESAIVREVGLRDGLQSISRVLPTAKKIEWIRDAYAAGQREIEVGSFVPSRLLPQLADTDQLVEFAKTLPGLCVSVLVPNLKGAERAIECGADLMLLPLSASRAQPCQSAQVSGRRRRRNRPHPRPARRKGIEVPDRSWYQHRVRLHVARQGRVGRSIAPVARGARRRSRSRRTGGHRRLCRSFDGSQPVRTSAADRRRPPELRTLSRHAWTRHGERLRSVADGYHALRCVPGRHRRLPVCAGRERQRVDRRRRLHVCQHGRFDRAGFRSVDCVARQGCAMA